MMKWKLITCGAIGFYILIALLTAIYHAYRGYIVELVETQSGRDKTWRDNQLLVAWYLYTPIRNFVFTLAGYVALAAETRLLYPLLQDPKAAKSLGAGAGILHAFLFAIALAGITGWLPELLHRWSGSGK